MNNYTKSTLKPKTYNNFRVILSNANVSFNFGNKILKSLYTLALFYILKLLGSLLTKYKKMKKYNFVKMLKLYDYSDAVQY